MCIMHTAYFKDQMLKRKKKVFTAVERNSFFTVAENDCVLRILSFILVGLL